MTESLEEFNALDKTYEIASDSDGVVILTYSLSSSPIHGLLSKLKQPKRIRIMYSAKSDAQRTLLQLKGMEKKCKALEIYSGADRFETSHAKIYLFCKTVRDKVNLTLVLGSFNLTLQTLMGIEIYGVYKFQINRNFFEENGIKHFIDIFSLDGKVNFSLNSLKQNISGEDREIGYDVLLLLLQLWFSQSIPTIMGNSTFEDVDFFLEENRRMFVSTFGNNTLLARLKDLLRSAFVYANEVGKEVELTIVTPFHTGEAIERLFWLKDQVLESVGLRGKAKFTLKLLTNSFNVSGEIDKSSFTDPMFLRKMMFESGRSPEFRAKFWGYTPGNEDFIHAKIYVIKVGERRAFLLTSANLTLSGFGFELQKNLEVGVIENQPEYTKELCNWVDECWDSEYTIESKDDKIWSELQNWYSRLEEVEEKIEEDFEIDGLTDLYIYEKHILKVRDKKNREIEFMKLILSFPKKEKPVKNLEEIFEKRGDQFYVGFKLKEEHLGPVFCDIIARLTDGTYKFVVQQKVNVIEKFPQFNMRVLPSISAPKDFLNGTIPVQVEIEIGKGISKIDLTKVSFELQIGEKQIRPEILLIKEKSEKNRTIQILLWPAVSEVSDNIRLSLIYENEKRVTSKISKSFLKEIFKKTLDEKIISFLKHKSIRLVTDEKTLCPKVESEFELSFDLSIAKSLEVDRIVVVRDFSHSELIGMKRIRKQATQEVQLSRKVRLDNNIPSYPPTDIEAWVYGVKRDKWSWWIPFGKLNYQLLKNPPDLEVEDNTSIKTNIAPIKMEFTLKGNGIFRDQIVLDYEIGDWKNHLITSEAKFTCKLAENLDLEKLEKGINLRYRFIFKYNVANIVGNIHIKYDFFVSSPHRSDPIKTKMLIFDHERPHELLNSVSKEIDEKRRPFLTVIPTSSTSFKEFRFQLNDKDFEESESDFVHLKNGTLALRRLNQKILNQFKGGKNAARFGVTIVPKDAQDRATIPFDIFYLEGIETNGVVMRKGGYGKTITVYHPDEYEDEFKEDIIKIIRSAYSKHLNDYHISRIRQRDAQYSWIIPKGKEEEVITEIGNFIEEVKSERFVPYFKPRKPLPPSDETTLSGRRVIDFILLIRRGRHELKIIVNEPSLNAIQKKEQK